MEEKIAELEKRIADLEEITGRWLPRKLKPGEKMDEKKLYNAIYRAISDSRD